MKEASQGYKVSLGFQECKDLRGLRGHQDKRVILENQDCQEQKGQEDPQEYRVTLETQDFLVFLAKMVHQVPQEFQDATGQRVRGGLWGLQVCLDSLEIPGHQGCQE